MNMHPPPDVSSPGLNKEQLALFVRGMWPHGPMRPTPPFQGALFSLMVLRFGTFCGTRVCWVYAHENALELGSFFPQVQNGAQVTELEGEKWQRP